MTTRSTRSSHSRQITMTSLSARQAPPLSERLATNVECPQSSARAKTNRRCDDGPFLLSPHFPVQRSRQQSIPLSPIVIGKCANQRKISDADRLALFTRRCSPVTFARRLQNLMRCSFNVEVG